MGRCINCLLNSVASPSRTRCLCSPGFAGRVRNATDPVDRVQQPGLKPYDYQQTFCTKCPRGANCDESSRRRQPWRPIPCRFRYGDNFYRCLLEAHCAGGVGADTCNGDRTGPLCALCKEGYQEWLTGNCNKCPDGAGSGVYFAFMIIVVLLILFIMIYIVLRSGEDLIEIARQDLIDRKAKEKGDSLSEIDDDDLVFPVRRHKGPYSIEGPPPPTPNFSYKLKIVISFIQIVTNLSIGLEIQWPSQFKNVMLYFNPTNLDFVQVSSVGCVVKGTTYYTKLVTVTMFPIFIALALIFGYLVPAYYCGLGSMNNCKCQLAGSNERKLSRRNFWKLFLFLMFIVYPGVSSVILRIYQCKLVEVVEGDPKWYLINDFTLNCYNEDWNTYAIYAAVFVLIYPFGIPALLFYRLLKKNVRRPGQQKFETRLDEPSVRAELGFLYDGYNRDSWWFEMFDMLEKLLVTSVVGFFPSDMQMPAGMVLVCLYLMTLLVWSPYLRKGDDRLAQIAQVEILMLLVAGHVFNQQVEPDKLMNVVMTVILITIVMLIVALFLVQAYQAIRKTCHTNTCCRRYVLRDPDWEKEPEALDDLVHRKRAEKIALESGYEADLFVKRVEKRKARTADNNDRTIMASNPLWNATMETGFTNEGGDNLEVTLNPLQAAALQGTRFDTTTKTPATTQADPADVEMTTFSNPLLVQQPVEPAKPVEVAVETQAEQQAHQQQQRTTATREEIDYEAGPRRKKKDIDDD